MLDDMAMRKLNPHTQVGYVRAVKKLAEFLGRSPERATPEEMRRFQMHLVASGISSTTLNATINGLRFFFEVTLRRLDALELQPPPSRLSSTRFVKLNGSPSPTVASANAMNTASPSSGRIIDDRRVNAIKP